MTERPVSPGAAVGFPPEQGLPAAGDADHGDLTQAYTLLSPEELNQLNRSAEAIVHNLTTPDILPVAQDIFTAEPPHPAETATPPLPHHRAL